MVLSSEVKCITSKYHRPTFEIMTAPYRRLVWLKETISDTDVCAADGAR